MRNPKNIILFRGKPDKDLSEAENDIIDDSGLVDCMNQLNTLRAAESTAKSVTVSIDERDILTKINQINAEMSWFSQWLTVKSNSAA